MNNKDILELKSILSAPKQIVIVPHKNPDGDAMGSTLGLYHFLAGLGHNATVIAPNDYPDFLKWLPSDDTVIKYDSQSELADNIINKADLIFTLDFNALSRTGAMETVLTQSKATKVLIDHHQQPDQYAAYVYSDVTMSSTCEMVFNFIEFNHGIDSITPEIATCLYTGIMTDTGSFKYRSTTSRTHRVIATLIDKGADNMQIHDNIYDTNSYQSLQLLGCALQNLRLLTEYKTVYITLSQEELDTHNFKKGDTEGFVNYGLSIKDVVMAVIFIENKQENIIKISLRSKGAFSVNDFARTHFNGGGHINAAGGRSDLSLSETVEKFISILPQYKLELNA